MRYGGTTNAALISFGFARLIQRIKKLVQYYTILLLRSRKHTLTINNKRYWTAPWYQNIFHFISSRDSDRPVLNDHAGKTCQRLTIYISFRLRFPPCISDIKMQYRNGVFRAFTFWHTKAILSIIAPEARNLKHGLNHRIYCSAVLK
jgi:hypothetical protein